MTASPRADCGSGGAFPQVLANVVGDVVHLFVGQLGVHRNREQASTGLLGYGHVAETMGMRLERRLQVAGDLVVDASADSLAVQVFAQPVALFSLDGIQVIDRFGIAARFEAFKAGVRQSLVVVTGYGDATAVVVFEKLQFESKHSGLQFIEAEVVADMGVFELADMAVMTVLA